MEQLAEVKRVVVEVATDTAVLNADDEQCLKMADYTTATHLCYVTMKPAPPAGAASTSAPAVAPSCWRGLNGDMITLFDTRAATCPCSGRT